jgi:hypothetical protein
VPTRAGERGRRQGSDQAGSANRREATVGDAVDVAKRSGERAIVDGGDRGAQDDRAKHVGAVDHRVREDREAREDFDERAHQWAPGCVSMSCRSCQRESEARSDEQCRCEPVDTQCL